MATAKPKQVAIVSELHVPSRACFGVYETTGCIATATTVPYLASATYKRIIATLRAVAEIPAMDS